MILMSEILAIAIVRSSGISTGFGETKSTRISFLPRERGSSAWMVDVPSNSKNCGEEFRDDTLSTPRVPGFDGPFSTLKLNVQFSTSVGALSERLTAIPIVSPSQYAPSRLGL